MVVVLDAVAELEALSDPGGLVLVLGGVSVADASSVSAPVSSEPHPNTLTQIAIPHACLNLPFTATHGTRLRAPTCCCFGEVGPAPYGSVCCSKRLSIIALARMVTELGPAGQNS